MSSVNAVPCTSSCCATTNHLPPISYGYAPRQCCGGAEAAPDVASFDWDLNWALNDTTAPSFYTARPAMDECPPPTLSPWVSPPLPEVPMPVVDSTQGTPHGFALGPHNDTPQMDFARGFPAPPPYLDENNNWCSTPMPLTNPSPGIFASSFVPPSPLFESGRVFPPFSCFMNQERHPMYASRQVDINNNDIGDRVAVEQVPDISSTPCPAYQPSSALPSPVVPPTPTCSPADSDPLPSPRIREILSSLLPRKRQQPFREPLRKQFPDLERIIIDFVTAMIRTAMFGEGRLQQVAIEEIESTTMVSLQQRLMDLVPGLAQRGISTTTVSRMLRPLNTRIIKTCLKDESAWNAVSDVLDVYDDYSIVGTELFDQLFDNSF